VGGGGVVGVVVVVGVCGGGLTFTRCGIRKRNTKAPIACAACYLPFLVIYLSSTLSFLSAYCHFLKKRAKIGHKIMKRRAKPTEP
jgi:hypothetical protein